MSSFASRTRSVLSLVFSQVLVAISASCVLLLCSNFASAAVSYTGGSYTQNFDSLPNSPNNASQGNTPNGWIDDTTTPGTGQFSIPGWYLWQPTAQGTGAEGGANQHQKFRAGDGTNNTGAFYSYGTSGSTERALGSLGANGLAASGTGEIYMGLRLHNDTGGILESFTLSYNGEQWRDGGAATPVAQSLTFGYNVGDANVQDGGFTAVPTLQFTSPVFTNTGSGAGVNGNVAGRTAIGPVTVSGINWLPGTDLWLRWTDLNDAGNDHGLAIDDLSFLTGTVAGSTWSSSSVDTSWTNPSNWTGNHVPVSGEIATFDNGGNGNTTISLGGAQQPIGFVRFNSGAAAYTIGTSPSDELLVDSGGNIYVNPGVTNLQTINAKVTGAGPLTIGNNAAGGLTLNGNVTSGGAVSISNTVSGSTVTLGGSLTATGGATLAATAGNMVLNGAIAPGGATTISGAGNVTFNTNAVISGTGALTSTNTGTLVIKAQHTYSGTTTLSGGAEVVQIGVSSNSPFTAGPFGTGTLTFNNSGAPPNLEASGTDQTIQNSVTITNSGFFVSSDPNGAHSLTLAGPVNQTVSRVITNNSMSATSLNFGSAASPSTLGLNAVTMTLQTQNNIAGANSGRTVFNDVISGTAAVTANQLVVQNGAIAVLNNANTYSGITLLQIGSGGSGNPTVLANNTSGSATGTGQVSVKVGFLGGTGTIAPTAPVTATLPGQVTVGTVGSSTAGVIAPGNNGIGTLTFDSSASANGPILSFQSGGSLLMELNNTAQSDKVAITGAAANDVVFTTTAVNFTDLTSGSTLAPGNYTLFSADAAGAYSGLGFDGTDPTKIISGLTIGTGLSAYPNTSLHLANGGQDIVLTIAAGTTPGDFNGDNNVNAADYVSWRKNDGTAAGYTAFRQNFQPSPVAGSSLDGAAVPEPTTIMLVLLSMIGLSSKRQQRSA